MFVTVTSIPSHTGRGFLLILRPTPELWTLALPHWTQILYLADVAFITSSLNIKKGSWVIEAGMPTVTEIRDQRAGIWLFNIYHLISIGCPSSNDMSLHFFTIFHTKGTGSASFSHSVARTIGTSGHLWSYEFHEVRFGKAKSVISFFPEKASTFF